MEFTLTELGHDEFAYQLREGDTVKAEITWTELADVMVVEHTFVDETMRNKGLAKKLLDQAAAYAREKGFKMEPVCSYAVVAFERYNEYEDVKV